MSGEQWATLAVVLAGGILIGLAVPSVRYLCAGQRRRLVLEARAIDDVLLIARMISTGAWKSPKERSRLTRRMARHCGPVSWLENMVMLGAVAASLVESDDEVLWAILRERMEAALVNHRPSR